MEPETLRMKLYEPIALVGGNKFKDINMKIRVNGGGTSNQVYAVRQAMAKGVLAYFQKFHDEQSMREMKEVFLQYDRNLLVTDPRRCEPKKFGGPGARARNQKSYR
jgi:small subunit ribosomal protein S16e